MGVDVRDYEHYNSPQQAAWMLPVSMAQEAESQAAEEDKTWAVCLQHESLEQDLAGK